MQSAYTVGKFEFVRRYDEREFPRYGAFVEQVMFILSVVFLATIYFAAIVMWFTNTLPPEDDLGETLLALLGGIFILTIIWIGFSHDIFK